MEKWRGRQEVQRWREGDVLTGEEGKDGEEMERRRGRRAEVMYVAGRWRGGGEAELEETRWRGGGEVQLRWRDGEQVRCS